MRFTILFLFLPFISFSQEETVRSGGTEVAINSSRLIATFLSPGTGSLSEQNESVFMIKINNKSKGAVRIGLDLQSTVVKDDDDVISTGLINLKLGYEGRRYVGEKWRANFGADIVFQSVTTNQETNDPYFGSNETKQINQQIGAEMVFGIQYLLSDRVKLFTESYLLATSDLEDIDFSSGSNRRQTGSSISLIPPTSLYLAITF